MLVSSCRCSRFCRKGKIDERFQEPYDKLVEIRNHLEKLSLTQAWALRETDLFMHQRKLDRIDESRVGGKFLDASGHPADMHAQRVRKAMAALSSDADSIRPFFISSNRAMFSYTDF